MPVVGYAANGCAVSTGVKRLLEQGEVSAQDIAARAMIPGVLGPPTQPAALVSIAVLGRTIRTFTSPPRPRFTP